MTQSVRAGMIANLPVAASVGVYGSVLGVLAAQKSISWSTLLMMNLSIFAGSAQFVMVDMWTPPLPIVEMTAAVLMINLRYLLIGASLKPVFKNTSIWHKLGVMHLVADENWAVTMAAHRNGKATTGFLFGGGICLVTIWCFGTMLGHTLGNAVTNPEAYALDFAFIAVFTALAVSLFRGAKDILPWLVAAIVAAVTEHWIPGKWYVLSGGVSGALMAVFHNPMRKGLKNDD